MAPREKNCEVCGGRIAPLEGGRGLGACKSCGLVYYLGDANRRQEEAAGGERPETTGREGVEGPPAAAPAFEGSPDADTHRWRCPDCEGVFEAETDSELGFAKREHLKEYHPNRPLD